MNNCIKCKRMECKNNYEFAVCKVTFLDDICRIEKSVATKDEIKKLFEENNLLYRKYSSFDYTCYRIDTNNGFILIRYRNIIWGGNIEASLIYNNFELWLNNKVIHGKFEHDIEYFYPEYAHNANYVKKYLKIYTKVARYKCLLLNAIHNNSF